MNITFDKYSKNYYLDFGDNHVIPLKFEELEALGESIHQIVQDEYSAQLQADLFGDVDCDGCKI